MDFEGLEQVRAETTKSVMQSLAEIVNDKKAPTEDRLKAAKVLDAMSDSLIKAYLLTQLQGSNEKMGNKMLNQLDKLDGKGER